MLLFLCEVVEAQAVDLAGSEAADPSNGCFGIGEQVQLHGRVRAEDDDAAADALVDPAPGVVQSRVTRGAWQSRVDASRTDDGTLTFSGSVRDGPMCWRSGAAARE